ncbi:MAG: hypothetical protein ACRDRS_04760, partial [Pseudonocardiaceae bacterium]
PDAVRAARPVRKSGMGKRPGEIRETRPMPTLTGRRVKLKVGDTELTIDRPTRGEVETVIKAVQSAIERGRS